MFPVTLSIRARALSHLPRATSASRVRSDKASPRELPSALRSVAIEFNSGSVWKLVEAEPPPYGSMFSEWGLCRTPGPDIHSAPARVCKGSTRQVAAG